MTDINLDAPENPIVEVEAYLRKVADTLNIPYEILITAYTAYDTNISIADICRPKDDK